MIAMLKNNALFNETILMINPSEYYEKQIINLNSLVELSLVINSNLDIDNILDVMTFIFMGQLMSESISIFSTSKFEENYFTLDKYKGSEDIKSSAKMIKSEAILDFFHSNPNPVIINKNLLRNELVDISDEINYLNGKIIAPLLIKDELIGIIILGAKINSAEYTDENLDFINIACRICATALENAKLFELATYDHKTGLFMFNNFKVKAKKEIARSNRFKKNFSLIMLDIDHFKKVNDTYGHNQGDTVLVHLSEIIRETIRDIDMPVRFGGEEFIILCPETSKEDAHILTKRLQQKIREYEFPGQSFPLKITSSFGVAEYNYKSPKNFKELIEEVDRALYHSKNNGRDMITLA